jgi:hypothetical protein
MCRRCWTVLGDAKVVAGTGHEYVRCPTSCLGPRYDDCARCGGGGWLRLDELTADDVDLAEDIFDEYGVLW